MNKNVLNLAIDYCSEKKVFEVKVYDSSYHALAYAEGLKDMDHVKNIQHLFADIYILDHMEEMVENIEVSNHG